MKNYFLLILLVTTAWGYSQKIEYINSTEHLAKNRPFSQATLVNNIIYLSGQIDFSWSCGYK
jgi:hypothetical protein